MSKLVNAQISLLAECSDVLSKYLLNMFLIHREQGHGNQEKYWRMSIHQLIKLTNFTLNYFFMTAPNHANKIPKQLCSKRVMDMMLYAVACEIAHKVVHPKKSDPPASRRMNNRSVK